VDWTLTLLRAALEGRMEDAIRVGALDRIERLRRRLIDTAAGLTFTDYGTLDNRDVPADAEPDPRGLTRTLSLGYLAEVSSMSPTQLRTVFRLVRAFRPRVCVELGSCVGISGAYILSALALNGAGRLLTFEGGREVAEMAVRNLHELGFTDFEVIVGRHQESVAPALASAAPVEFALVDGDHSERSTLMYHELLLAHAADRAILYYDDIRWSAGMTRAWERIGGRGSRGIRAAIDLGRAGVCLVDADHHGVPSRLTLPIE
jgi:predicted O-methyltransferase YrrM